MSTFDFASFFRAVHGTTPFPWQTRAAERLARREVFGVTVPTGLGKSALVDAAVWAAGQGAWRRIVFVVDRRIVVDAVHERALRIADRLGRDPSLAPIAARIGDMQVVRLRGGVFGDDDWVLYPERLTVALTTVDQLGSRLLFRGYGVSSRRWPLHAGFFGSDTLVVIDEAHLSVPFVQTLTTLQRHGADIALVPMSATLPDAARPDAVALDADDLAVETVRQRLAARKLVTLAAAGPGEADLVKHLAGAAAELAGGSAVGRVAIVVNRVATARRCFGALVAAGHVAELLTGRVRPVDRDARLAALLPRVAAGAPRPDGTAPLFVVATQTIEVGADLDFDALVTECASLSALRQRFGRMDRLGERGTSRGVIVLRITKDDDDPIYGESLAQAWEWLRERAAEHDDTIDFGLESLDTLMAGHPPPAEPTRHAASLLPTHLELLAQTGPLAPQLDLGAWLHGSSARLPDVTLVWRDDLDPDDSSDWPRAVGWLPPMLREGLPLPVAVARRWLAGARADEHWGDAGGLDDDEAGGDRAERAVLRWRGADDCEVTAAGRIRPGDTVVLPSAYGGCDAWGWAPDATQPVEDRADACQIERLRAGLSRQIVIRLCDGRWHVFGDAAVGLRDKARALEAVLAEALVADDDMDDALQTAREGLVAAARASGHPLALELHDPRIESHPRGFVLRDRIVEEVAGVIETGCAVPLDAHHADVARWARRLAADDPHAQAIVDAARVHDAGKAEPRMQALLHGSAIRAASGELLAKSALRRRDQQLAAWQSAGLPRGFRHEFASLVLASIDDPLTRHLTATHHGFGRPWLPACDDPEAPGAEYAALRAHWPAAWAKALRTHGPWKLARMEWLLRSADARASIEEAQAAPGGGDA